MALVWADIFIWVRAARAPTCADISSTGKTKRGKNIRGRCVGLSDEAATNKQPTIKSIGERKYKKRRKYVLTESMPDTEPNIDRLGMIFCCWKSVLAITVFEAENDIMHM